MKRIYKTTVGNYYSSDREIRGYRDQSAHDPKVPEEAGDWELIGSAAADGLLFWFWRGTELEP